MQSAAAELPQRKHTFRLGGKDTNTGSCFYDVRFYPYVKPGIDPVFAVTGEGGTFVCRCRAKKNDAVEVLRWFRDDEKDPQTGRALPPNSLTWSKDVESGTPLLCVAGESPKIKILDVESGKLFRTLTGHGQLINDLQTSPENPMLLASASMDNDIRIWNLDQGVEAHPCAVILGGQGGHKEGVLTTSFHHTGRYVASGGMDTVVNLWVIPELPNENSGTDKVTQIHYPHFSSTEIHTDFIDCIRFHSDLLLSRSAKENKIQLWRIDGFNSNNPPPPPSTAPPPSPQSPPTRSAFGGRFQRLLTFDTPSTTLFYMRFGLFHQPAKHPILAMGNERSKIFWWDLQKLEEGFGTVVPAPSATTDAGFKRPPARVKKHSFHERGSSVGGGISTGPNKTGVSAFREESIVSNTSSGMASSVSSAPPEKKFAIGDPFAPIVAHKTLTVSKVTFATRAVSWSPGGEWCVVAGDNGMVCLFRRWE